MKKQNINFLSGLLAFGILLAWATHAQQTPEQIEVAKKSRNSTVRLVSEWDGHPNSNSIEPGTSIFAVGTPTGEEEGQITHGTFNSIRKSDEKLQLKTTVSPGDSGGPVLS